MPTQSASSAEPQASDGLQPLLDLMARHGIAPTPANYALWFEYARGENAALCEEMDGLIAAGTPFAEALLLDLVQRHLDNRFHGAAALAASKRISEILTDLLKDLATLLAETSGYDDRLQQHLEDLASPGERDHLPALLEVLAEETKQVRRLTRSLREDFARHGDEISAMQAELERVKHSANSDPLTGLPNRRALLDAMDRLELDGNARHSLLMIDIDNFKAINDEHGHLVGDRVIRFVADVIRKNTKGQDTPARFGGEEFAVLLPTTPMAGALAVAEKIRHLIASARLVRAANQLPLGQITISGGVATHHRGEDILELMERADQALYLAKERGRNKVVPETEL